VDLVASVLKPVVFYFQFECINNRIITYASNQTPAGATL
jgi:hypothetical protein